MTRKEFEDIKAKSAVLRYRSLEHADYESVAHFSVFRCDDTAILLYGSNQDVNLQELHYGVNDLQLLIETVKTLPGSTLVTFIPEEHKRLFMKKDFTVFNEIQDYWLEDIAGLRLDAGGVRAPCFIEAGEYAAASELTKSVQWQGRDFFLSEGWFESWVTGENPEAADCGATAGNVIVHRNEHEITGLVCVALYGHQNQKGMVVWIRELGVQPDRQGKGVGRELLCQALRYGAAGGAKRAFLAVDTRNTAAVRLYVSIGFIPEEGCVQLDMIYRPGKKDDNV